MHDPLAITLAVLCALIMIGVLHQMYLIVRGGHNFYSLQTGVLGLCVLWLPLRVVFWVKVQAGSEWNMYIMMIFYSLPTCLQFTTFSLLALFYAKVVNWRQWDGRNRQLADSDDTAGRYYSSRSSYRGSTPPVPAVYARTQRCCSRPCGCECCLAMPSWSVRTRFLIIFWASNFLVWLITIVAAIFNAEDDDKATDRMRVWVDSAIFLLLSIVLARLGLQFRDTQQSRAGGAFSAHMLPRGPQAFGALNLCLCFSFVCRAVFQILLLLAPGFPDHARHVPTDGSYPLHWLVFVLYLVWEIVPTAAILIMLGKIPAKRRRATVRFRSPAKLHAKGLGTADGGAGGGGVAEGECDGSVRGGGAGAFGAPGVSVGGAAGSSLANPLLGRHHSDDGVFSFRNAVAVSDEAAPGSGAALGGGRRRASGGVSGRVGGTGVNARGLQQGGRGSAQATGGTAADGSPQALSATPPRPLPIRTLRAPNQPPPGSRRITFSGDAKRQQHHHSSSSLSSRGGIASSAGSMASSAGSASGAEESVFNDRNRYDSPSSPGATISKHMGGGAAGKMAGAVADSPSRNLPLQGALTGELGSPPGRGSGNQYVGLSPRDILLGIGNSQVVGADGDVTIMSTLAPSVPSSGSLYTS